MDTRAQARIIDARRAAVDLAVPQLWRAYRARGGSVDCGALAEFLNGQLSLPQAQVDLLAQALSSLLLRRDLEPPRRQRSVS